MPPMAVVQRAADGDTVRTSRLATASLSGCILAEVKLWRLAISVRLLRPGAGAGGLPAGAPLKNAPAASGGASRTRSADPPSGPSRRKLVARSGTGAR